VVLSTLFHGEALGSSIRTRVAIGGEIRGRVFYDIEKRERLEIYTEIIQVYAGATLATLATGHSTTRLFLRCYIARQSDGVESNH